MLWLRHSDVAPVGRSDVMFAHFAARRNITHAVNITAEGNITCPQGQTSFQNKNGTLCVLPRHPHFVCGENSHALPLTSELDALCGGECEPDSARERAERGTTMEWRLKTKTVRCAYFPATLTSPASKIRTPCRLRASSTRSAAANANRILRAGAQSAGQRWSDGSKQKRYAVRTVFVLRGATRNRTGDKGFADPCLTAWPWRHIRFLRIALNDCKDTARRSVVTPQDKQSFTVQHGCNQLAPVKWSGLRGSNPPPRPWQGRALPNELNPRKWCLRSESNQRHGDFQSPALPTELQRHKSKTSIKWRPGRDSNPRPLA